MQGHCERILSKTASNLVSDKIFVKPLHDKFDVDLHNQN